MATEPRADRGMDQVGAVVSRAGATAPGPKPLLTRLNARGFRLIYLLDVVVLLAVMVGAMLVRFGTEWPTYPLRHYAFGFAASTAIITLVLYFGGLYEREPRLGAPAKLPRIALLMAASLLLITATILATGTQFMPRLNLAALGVLGSLGLAANRVLARWLRSQREGPPRIVLVGVPDEVNLATTHLDATGEGKVVATTGTTADVLRQVRESSGTDVLLLSPRGLDALYPEPLATLEAAQVSVLQRITARDVLLGLKSVREVGGMPFSPVRAHTLPASRTRLKRYIELLLLALGAPVVLLVAGATAVYVRIVAGKHILFFQDRVGRDGRVFRMVKFRTMRPDAEEGVGPVLAGRDDDRIIPACRWLRTTRLDEVPQLWNVLRGEMSLVGPRPERPEWTAQFERLIPGYGRRHEIPPGLTGLAQVSGRYHTDPEYKLGHDLQYLVNWSPVLDLQILARTVWVVLARRL